MGQKTVQEWWGWWSGGGENPQWVIDKMPCSQDLHGSFIEIKEAGEEREKKKYRKKEEEVRGSLLLEKSRGKEIGSGRSLFLKRTFELA